MHFRGLEQAAAKIYINAPKNTGLFKNYTKQTPLFFAKSTRMPLFDFSYLSFKDSL